MSCITLPWFWCFRRYTSGYGNTLWWIFGFAAYADWANVPLPPVQEVRVTKHRLHVGKTLASTFSKPFLGSVLGKNLSAQCEIISLKSMKNWMHWTVWFQCQVKQALNLVEWWGGKKRRARVLAQKWRLIFSYASSSTLYSCERVSDSFGLA